jgi:hypothetical protein
MAEGEAYPRFRAEVARLIRLELLHVRQARAIARRAGIRQGTAAAGLPQVIASFSATNSPDGQELSFDAEDEFPIASAPLVVDGDFAGPSEIALLVNVAVAGPSGAAFEWRCSLFDSTPSVPIDATGLFVSDYVTVSGGEDVAEVWVVSSSGGDATVGLVQGLGR